MALRIDEYGHIIRDEDSTSNSTVESPSNTSLGYASNNRAGVGYSSRILETSIPWYGKAGVFWTITMILSAAVASFLSMVIAPMIFETKSGDLDLLESIVNFLVGLAPYAVFIGSFIGCILYNINGTKRNGENFHKASEYILSLVCAVAGSVAMGLLIYLLVVAVYIIAAVVVIGLVILFIIGLASGDS